MKRYAPKPVPVVGKCRLRFSELLPKPAAAILRPLPISPCLHEARRPDHHSPLKTRCCQCEQNATVGRVDYAALLGDTLGFTFVYMRGYQQEKKRRKKGIAVVSVGKPQQQ